VLLSIGMIDDDDAKLMKAFTIEKTQIVIAKASAGMRARARQGESLLYERLLVTVPSCACCANLIVIHDS